MTSKTATVEALTAEVRVLMVGSRQVTMSVYSQLDRVAYRDIEPFGRVRPKDAHWSTAYVVGADRESGTLVRSDTWIWEMVRQPSLREVADAKLRLHGQSWRELDLADLQVIADDAGDMRRWGQANREQAKRMITERITQREWMAESHADWESLPLIVLAGLR